MSKVFDLQPSFDQPFQFSETSKTGKIPQGRIKKAILADALMDWGNCMAGAEPPENFGHGMVEVGKALGVTATPEKLMRLSQSEEFSAKK